MRLPARDGGNDQQLVAVGDLGRGAVQKTHVVIVHVDVGEAPDLSLRAAQLPLEARVAIFEPLQNLADCGALEEDQLLAVRLPPQDRRDSRLECHDDLRMPCARGGAPADEDKEDGPVAAGSATTASSKLSRRGSMTG